GDDALDALRAAAPRHRPATVVPKQALDHVVAVTQRGDQGARQLVAARADETIASGDDTTDPGRAAGPGHRPATAVPKWALDHVVATAQGDDAEVPAAHLIAGVAADEAVRLGDGALDALRAAPPRHRPAATVPNNVSDHVVAV